MLKRISNYAFYLALSIEIFLVILDKSVYIIQYEAYWFRLTFVLFAIKLVLTKYNTREWLTIGTFVLLGVISYLVTGHNEILRVVVLVAACTDINHEFMFKLLLYGTLFGCLILMGLSFAGIGEFSITRDFGRGEIETRYCLGFGHPNGLHTMFWAICSLILYVYRKSIRWFHLLIMLLGNVGLFFLTDSRTSVITMTFMLVCFAFMLPRNVYNHPKTVYFLACIEAGIALFTSFIMMSHKLFWDRVIDYDYLLTGRMTYTHVEVTEAKTFFWLPLSTLSRYRASDLGIVKMTYWYGYIPTIFFLVLCCTLILTAMKHKDGASVVIVASIILYSIFEAHEVSVYLARNYVFFLLGSYWTKMINSDEKGRYYIIDLIKSTGVTEAKNV